MATSASTYRHSPSLSQRKRFVQSRHLLKLLRQFGQRGRVVEIGVGTGDFALCCREGRIPYLGIEPSYVHSQDLCALGYQVLVTSVPPLPELPTDVDGFVLIHVLEHFKDEKMVRDLFKQLFTSLCSGGLVALICPDVRGGLTLFSGFDQTHLFPTKPENLKELLENSGFRVVHREEFLGYAPGCLPFIVSAALRFFTKPVLDLLAWRGREMGPLRLKIAKSLYPCFLLVAYKPESLNQ